MFLCKEAMVSVGGINTDPADRAVSGSGVRLMFLWHQLPGHILHHPPPAVAQQDKAHEEQEEEAKDEQEHKDDVDISEIEILVVVSGDTRSCS